LTPILFSKATIFVKRKVYSLYVFFYISYFKNLEINLLMCALITIGNSLAGHYIQTVQAEFAVPRIQINYFPHT